jgi:hypothetical protein
MRRLHVCLAVLALTACQEREPTGPDALLRPQMSHATLHQEPGFRFISPTPPGNPPIAGVFNATLTPVVEIWSLNGALGDEVAKVAELNATVSMAPEQYQTEWTGLHNLARGYYRIEVRSAPSDEPHQFFGSVEVQLTTGGGSGLDVSGNTLPIKFWISTEGSCTGDDCVGFTAYNDRRTQIILEESESEGSAGFRFEPGFCARQSPDDTTCLEYITVIATRYRGPERCIPDPGFTGAGSAALPTIQYEVCVRVRTIPENVTFIPGTVFAYICADLRAHALQEKQLLRLLQVKEDAAGNATGPAQDRTVTDPASDLYFFQCRDDVFSAGTQEASAEAARAPGRLARFSALAQRALTRAGRYLAPAPAYARRRAHFPLVGSPIGFSRLGLVVPVTAEFSPLTAIAGPQHQLLPAADQPRVRVLATYPDGTTPAEAVGVPFVQVRFTPDAGDGSVALTIDSTNADGYVSAQWTLGAAANNPQRLVAEVGAPRPYAGVIPIFPNGEDPDDPDAHWWASHTFTATAWQYAVRFLTPLGSSSSGLTNVVFPANSLPSVRRCGPLQTTTGCTTIGTAKLKNNAYEISWSTGKSGADGELYRIEVVVNGLVTGTFHAQRGGGGGGTTDPLGSLNNPYRFQTGANVPIRFMVVLP